MNHAGVIPINSLLFQVERSIASESASTDTVETFDVIAVVPSSSKVTIRQLEEHFQVDNWDERIPNPQVKCSLVPQDEVETRCGFPPQSVPPLGHVPHTLRILVDLSLCSQLPPKKSILVGGGGHNRIGCLLDAQLLLMLEGTEVASLTKESLRIQQELQHEQHPQQQSSTFDAERSADTLPASLMEFQTPTIKPFFPLAPPSMDDVHQVLNHPDQPNPLKPLPFAFVGRINGIRRMARRLVFCDIAPPDYKGSGTKTDAYDLPWKSGLDQQEMSAQLILGKTFLKHWGDKDGTEALKQLRVGQLLYIEGKTNVGNRDSLRHWAEKRSLDIVVFNYRLLEESPNVLAGQQQQRQRGMPFTTTTANKNDAQNKLPSVPKPRRIPSAAPEDCLQMNDIFPNNDGEANKSIIMVDDLDGIRDFHNSVNQLLTESRKKEVISTSADPRITQSAPLLVGVDCEWKPTFMLESTAEKQPVLLLQISLQELQKVFLFDLQTLLRPCLEPTNETNSLEEETSQALTAIFGDPSFVKVGFQVMTDLRQLAGSYPHIPAFRSFEAVLEVGSVAKVAMQLAKVPKARQWIGSLTRLSEKFYDKPMNKEQQISDWSCRPLSEEQLIYGALDAAVTPGILEKAMALANVQWNEGLQLKRNIDDRVFSKAITSLRFVFLNRDSSSAAIRKLKAKTIVSDEWLVTQKWVTGQAVPEMPSVPARSEEPYIDYEGVLRVPSKSLQLHSNPNFVRDLVGERLGNSKDKCFEALLLDHPSFPKGAKLEYNPRSGFVEFDDAVALFVNMPIRPNEPTPRRGYPNVWLEDGRVMTWFLRQNEWQDGSSVLAQKLMGTPRGNDDDESSSTFSSSCVLFVRMNKGGFLCCGSCRLIPSGGKEGGDDKQEEMVGGEDDNDLLLNNDDNEENDDASHSSSSYGENKWGLVELHLELVDWERLSEVDDFVDMAFSPSTQLSRKVNGMVASHSQY